MHYIISDCVPGIGNRLYNLIYSSIFSKKTNYDLKINWRKNSHLNCNFEDIISFDFNYSHSTDIEVSKTEKYLFESNLEDGTPIIKNKNSFYIDVYRGFASPGINIHDLYTEYKNICKLITPSNYIKNKLSVIENTKILGVHIRRTDQKMSIRNSPSYLFYEKIKEYCHKYDRIYVSSDDVNEKNIIKQKFGSKVIDHNCSSYKRDSIGSIDAIIDLFNLSNCDYILGSYGSSFSDIASNLKNKYLEVLKK